MEERISELKGRNLAMIQVEEERELRSKKIKKYYENYLTLLGRATLDNRYPRRKREEGSREST